MKKANSTAATGGTATETQPANAGGITTPPAEGQDHSEGTDGGTAPSPAGQEKVGGQSTPENSPAPAAAAGGTKVSPEEKDKTVSELAAENAALKERLAEIDRKKTDDDEFEQAVTKRMRHGLSRPQAIACEQRQRDFNRVKAGKWAARRPRLLEIIAANSDRLQARRVAGSEFTDLTSDEFNAALESRQDKAA